MQRELKDAQTVPATKTYNGEMSIDLDGRTVWIGDQGTAHSPGDQTIYLPEVQTLFVGDLIEERIFLIVPCFPPNIPRSAIKVGRWKETLAEVERLNPAVIVPGHGNLGRAEIAQSVREYLVDVEQRVQRSRASESLERAVSQGECRVADCISNLAAAAVH